MLAIITTFIETRLEPHTNGLMNQTLTVFYPDCISSKDWNGGGGLCYGSTGYAASDMKVYPVIE